MKPADSLSLVAGGAEIYIPLSGMLDEEEERKRLTAELDSLQRQVERLEKLLASDFALKAPPAVVQKERERLATFQQTAEKLAAQLKGAA